MAAGVEVTRFVHLYFVPLFEQTSVPDVFPTWLFVHVPPSLAVAPRAGMVAAVVRSTAVAATSFGNRLFDSRMKYLRSIGVLGAAPSVVEKVPAGTSVAAPLATLRA